MNKVKTVFWIIILGLIVLVFFQNKEFFLAEQSLRINLYILAEYRSPQIANAILFLAVFLVGLLIAYFLGLAERFRLKRTIKNLNATIASQTQKMPSPEREADPKIGSPPEPDQSADNREI